MILSRQLVYNRGVFYTAGAGFYGLRRSAVPKLPGTELRF